MQTKTRRARLGGALLALMTLALTATIACGGGRDSSGDGTFLQDGTNSDRLSSDSTSGAKGPAGPAGAGGVAMATATASAPAPELPGRDTMQLFVPDSGYGISEEYWQRLQEAGFDAEYANQLADIQSQINALANDADAQQALDYKVANAAQERVIVRTVDMDIEVDGVTSALEDIGNVAINLGGWVVSSNQQLGREGFISLRVPAAELDTALAQIRAIAAEINSEVATSQDFTEEFTDTAARIDTLTLTLETLRALFDRAATVEEAISVQAEITRVQSDLESLQARLEYLEQSSAFSLVKIEMSAKPTDITVRAGEDLVIAEGRPHNFQAKFTPPEGIDSYVITWNFGDGSNERSTDRVAPTTVEGEYITSPVGHIYGSEDSSPFIVTVEIRGTGQGGIVEGKDTLVATVQRIPAIEVFAGEGWIVDEGQEVTFRGSFTRPEGITDLTAEWNFGDGSTPVEVELAEGTTVVEATHSYENYRPAAYSVSLKVFGNSPAGMAEGIDDLSVQVRQPERVSASGFDAGGTSRSAAQALTNIGTALASFGIWAAILSPIWLLALVALYLGRHRIAHLRG